MRMAAVCVHDVVASLADETRQPAHAEIVRLAAEWQLDAVDLDAAVRVGGVEGIRSAGEPHVVAVLDETLHQPACLCLAAAPAGLLVDVKDSHCLMTSRDA